MDIVKKKLCVMIKLPSHTPGFIQEGSRSALPKL